MSEHPDRQSTEWYLDLVDYRPHRDIAELQRDLTRMGFNRLFVDKYAEMRWELVDGLSSSLAERVN